MRPEQPEPSATTYVFGPFRLLPQRQLLTLNGTPVRIGARAFDLLTLLVRRAGEVVSKNDLLAFGWPSTFVHESNLKVNVAALRRVLGDGEAGSFIATVPGRGYRFVADVEVGQEEPAPARAAAPSPEPSSNPTSSAARTRSPSWRRGSRAPAA